MKMFSLIQVAVIAIAMTFSTAVASVTSYDPAADFSLSGNPNGPWSYGYAQTLGGPLIVHATSGSGGGLDFWNTDISIGLPWVVRNSTAAPINWAGTTVFAPGALSLHPGPNGQVAVLRFTVPAAGQYLVNGSFFGQDYVGPTTTDVHLLVNGTSIFNDVVSDFGVNHSFNTTLTLAAGSQLDFAVGFGPITPNVYDSYYYDSTGLSALITLVPEPSSLALVGLAAGMLCRFRLR
jgi:hypothetical protein